MKDTALLVIDVQVGLIEEGAYQPDTLIKHIQGLIQSARAAHVPVIYVQHNESHPQGSLNPANPGHAIHPDIAPQPGDTIIQKHNPDSFQDTDLAAKLEAMGIKNLVVSGMQTELCVDTTCRAAYQRGYKVTLASDAHTTFNSKVLSAQQIIDHHNVTLGDFFVTPKPSAEITFNN